MSKPVTKSQEPSAKNKDEKNKKSENSTQK